VSGIKSSGVESLLDADAPFIGVNGEEYFTTRESRRSFIQTVEAAPPRMLSLCLPEDLDTAKEAIARRGLEVGRVTPVRVPFFSQRGVIGMMLVEVLRPGGPDAREKLDEFWSKSALAESDYRAEISALDAPKTLRAGERAALRFRVRNGGGSVWPARGNAKGMFQVNIGDRWLDAGGRKVVNDLDARAGLPADLPPGGEVELVLTVGAPKEPGDYVLEIDMIHEGITFFREKGSRVLTLPVRVGP
jgi:hypothetical protein